MRGTREHTVFKRIQAATKEFSRPLSALSAWSYRFVARLGQNQPRSSPDFGRKLPSRMKLRLTRGFRGESGVSGGFHPLGIFFFFHVNVVDFVAFPMAWEMSCQQRT